MLLSDAKFFRFCFSAPVVYREPTSKIPTLIGVSDFKVVHEAHHRILIEYATKIGPFSQWIKNVNYWISSDRLAMIGGDAVTDETFYLCKHQIAVHINNSFFRGGAIVSGEKIITVAHCVYGDHPEDLSIQAGTLNSGAGEIKRKYTYIQNTMIITALTMWLY